MSTILIVDDDPAVRFMFRVILEPAGHEVVEPGTAAISIVVGSGHPVAAQALQASGLVEGVAIKPFDPSALEACIRAVASTRMSTEVSQH